MKNNHNYKIKYTLEHEYGNFKADDLIKEGKGGCDAYIFTSILYHDDGSYSVKYFSRCDGNESLSPEEEFKAWVLMGSRIEERLEEVGEEGKAIIAGTPLDMMRALMKNPASISA